MSEQKEGENRQQLPCVQTPSCTHQHHAQGWNKLWVHPSVTLAIRFRPLHEGDQPHFLTSVSNLSTDVPG